LLEHVKVLDQVHAGDLLGTIIDPWDGAEKQRLRAPFGGVVVTARRTARVQAGDGTYMIALPEAD
jgi:predicted deacylase